MKQERGSLFLNQGVLEICCEWMPRKKMRMLANVIISYCRHRDFSLVFSSTVRKNARATDWHVRWGSCEREVCFALGKIAALGGRVFLLSSAMTRLAPRPRRSQNKRRVRRNFPPRNDKALWRLLLLPIPSRLRPLRYFPAVPLAMCATVWLHTRLPTSRALRDFNSLAADEKAS